MLRAQGVTKRYAGGRLALDDVSFAVPDGALCVMLGHNGAGKTTAMHCFLDLVRPDAGTAEIDGVVVARAPVAARLNVSYLPESVALYPSLTGRENVRFFVRLAGRPCTPGAAAAALTAIGIDASASSRPVRTYSKGMRQRVGLAIAVASGARNLILDEPTSGLDPAAADELMALLHAMSRRGTAVLASSHDLAQAARYADTLVRLENGRVAEASSAVACAAPGVATFPAESGAVAVEVTP